MCIRCGNVYSKQFTISNGVRQGGILSLMLFNVYVVDLSGEFNSKNVGVKYNGVIINHLMYADDLVLFAPSSAGLSKLLRICEKAGITHNILYNSKKSAVMITRSALRRDSVLPSFTLCSNILKVVHVVKCLGHYVNDNLTENANISRQSLGNSIYRKTFCCESFICVAWMLS